MNYPNCISSSRKVDTSTKCLTLQKLITMKNLFLTVCLLTSLHPFAQTFQSYTNDRGEKHLCGPFTLEIIENDSTYRGWFSEAYDALSFNSEDNTWVKNLNDVKVDIYLGTWCGDSKKWVPRFVKLWDELGLDRNQLNFIALYDTDEKYKQGPNNEQDGLNIHRVPTFIFKKEGEEYARIVESPRTNLITDLSQIALNVPSAPNYRAASYMLNLFDTKPLDDIKANLRSHLYEVYHLVGKSGELNTLGYVLLRSNRIEEALIVFELNTYFYRFDPNVFDSYGEALAIAGEKEKAISNYEKVLAIDAENENAKAQLEDLKSK